MSRPTAIPVNTKNAERPSNNLGSFPGQQGSPMWIMTDGAEVIIQFLDHPDDLTKYSETRANTLRFVSGDWISGPMAGQARDVLPYGFRDIVALDYKIVEKDGVPMIYKNYRDPINVGPGLELDLFRDILSGDDLLYGKDDDGNPISTWKVAPNVLVHFWPEKLRKDGSKSRTPEAGDHILLKFNMADWNRVSEKLNERAEEGIDIMAYKWGITLFKAEGKGKNRTAKVVMRGPAEPVETNLYSLTEETDRRREEFVNYIRSVWADANAPAVPQEKEEAPQSVIKNPRMKSTVQLRKLLAANNIEVPEGASRPMLISLAEENGLE